MDFIYQPNRISLNNPTGQTIAEITFPSVSKYCVNIDHTFVDDSLRGQGVAGKLMQAAVETLKNQQLRAFATCPYAAKWFEKHTEYSDMYAGNPESK